LRWTILWSGGVSDATLFSQCFVALVEAEYRQSRLWPFECKSLFLTIISREPRIGSKPNYQYSTRRVAESTSSWTAYVAIRSNAAFAKKRIAVPLFLLSCMKIFFEMQYRQLAEYSQFRRINRWSAATDTIKAHTSPLTKSLCTAKLQMKNWMHLRRINWWTAAADSALFSAHKEKLH
jgi:hypothetical protein